MLLSPDVNNALYKISARNQYIFLYHSIFLYHHLGWGEV
jgi:hypothetical protein